MTSYKVLDEQWRAWPNTGKSVWFARLEPNDCNLAITEGMMDIPSTLDSDLIPNTHSGSGTNGCICRMKSSSHHIVPAFGSK